MTMNEIHQVFMHANSSHEGDVVDHPLFRVDVKHRVDVFALFFTLTFGNTHESRDHH